MRISRLGIGMLACAALLPAANPQWTSAHELYQRTEYRESLNLLLSASGPDPASIQLIGQNYFMLGDYKKATDSLDRALAAEGSSAPPDAQLYLWLGRAYGRRAEMANPFSAPGLASRAHKFFEKAVDADISNKEAVGDLFDYYLGAPGFLGGGLNRAEDLARRVGARDPAESQYLLAQIDDKRKQYDQAELHLRKALDLAPKQVGRVLDLARFLAKHGRTQESDALFERAARMEPHNPRVLFYRAEAYVEGRRHLADARGLLESYVQLPLTPDDPPREAAQTLLARISGNQATGKKTR